MYYNIINNNIIGVIQIYFENIKCIQFIHDSSLCV